MNIGQTNINNNAATMDARCDHSFLWLRRFSIKKLSVFVVTIALMLCISLAINLQYSPTNFQDKSNTPDLSSYSEEAKDSKHLQKLQTGLRALALKARQASVEKAQEEVATDVKAEQNSGNSGRENNKPVDEIQWVGLAAHARKYLGRDDLICDWLVDLAMVDMGYQYVTITVSRARNNSLVKNNWKETAPNNFPQVSISDARPGDVISSPGHVEIYLGANQSIHGGYGPNYSSVVVARSSLHKADAVYRPTPGVDTTPAQWWDYAKYLREVRDRFAPQPYENITYDADGNETGRTSGVLDNEHNREMYAKYDYQLNNRIVETQ